MPPLLLMSKEFYLFPARSTDNNSPALICNKGTPQVFWFFSCLVSFYRLFSISFLPVALSYQNSPIPQSAENRGSLPILRAYCWYAANGFIFNYALVSKLFRVFSIFTASSLVIGIPLLASPHSHYKTLCTLYCPMAVFCIPPLPQKSCHKINRFQYILPWNGF